MDYTVISFYRYTKIEKPENLRETLFALCQKLQILGRILIAEEGINGAVSGKKEAISKFKDTIETDLGFNGLTYREQENGTIAYHKLVVRVRKEVCAFATAVDVGNAGVRISPTTIKQWYDSKQDFVIIDARNDYEYDVGHFQNAIKMPIENFREFPQALPILRPQQNKKIVLYCTGGIRCEKASAYLKEQGFPEVYHLEGGVINYVNQFPDTYWRGGLFVFDDRLVSDVGKPITQCVHCRIKTSEYINCHNLDCDTLIISCQECQKKMEKTCSEECKRAPRKRTIREQQIPLKIVGKIENYYPKKGIAVMRVSEGKISVGDRVGIKGKTTSLFRQQIGKLLDEGEQEISIAEEGMMVTFPVIQKVRKNDLVLLD